MPKHNFPFGKAHNHTDFSIEGLEIHAVCKLLHHDDNRFTQAKIVSFAEQLLANDVEYAASYSVFDNRELSLLKKDNSEKGRARAKEVLDLLKEILKLRGLVIEKTTLEDGHLLVEYRRTGTKPIAFRDSTTVNAGILRKYGLVNILPHEPSQEINAIIKSTYELRILQSCLYGWESDWEVVLREGLDKGELTKIKFLLTQPFSDTAFARAHTISENNVDPIHNFNNRVRAILGQIINFSKSYHGLDKPGTDEKFDIQIRLYYAPTPIPIYQCFNKNGHNINTYFGIYWQHESSRTGPHLQVSGNKGDLIKYINGHFNKVWKREFKENIKDLDWYNINGLRKNISVSIDEEEEEEIYQALKKAYKLKNFNNYHKAKPKWVSFKCSYHNRENETRNFILDIDRKMQKARVRQTYMGNVYYGIAINIQKSYSVILHTTREKTPDRIMTINFFVGGSDLEKVDRLLFGIYTNNDSETNFPYAQVMILERIKVNQDEQIIDSKSTSSAFEYFAPTIKEKKIDIQHEEIALSEKNAIKGNYIFRFEHHNRDNFYQRLKEEINHAQNEVFFLGHGPNHFPNAKSETMDDYFNSHLLLAKEKHVRIYRILLDCEMSQEFIDSLVDIKKDEVARKCYSIFVLKTPIPIISDLVLIDPLYESRTAILTYTRTEKRRFEKITYPVKMEVIKDDLMIINSLKQTCENYLNLDKEFLIELDSPELVQKHLKPR